LEGKAERDRIHMVARPMKNCDAIVDCDNLGDLCDKQVALRANLNNRDSVKRSRIGLAEFFNQHQGRFVTDFNCEGRAFCGLPCCG
jgi:hypothetical protein